MNDIRMLLRSIGVSGAAMSAAILAACAGDSPDPDLPGQHEAHAEEQAATDPHAAHGQAGNEVGLDEALARRLGVTFAEARREDLQRTVRATGQVVWDETRLSTESLRFGGWAEHLHVDFTGRQVAAGEPLLDVYSPELVSAQEDLIGAGRLAAELAGSRVPGSPGHGEAVLEAARERLRYWKVAEEDIRAVEESGIVRPHLTFSTARSGFVVEKNVQVGERFEAGTPLYRIADLSHVWLEVDVYERDLPFVRLGSEVEVETPAVPGERLLAEIAYIYPDVDRDRRTARVRVDLPNPEGLLRPGMYATARALVVVAEDAITVPRDAVMYTGERTLVFLAPGDGSYEAREVEVGAEAGDRVEIRSGLEVGERVVARSGFILDAESRLMEAMMGQPGMPGMDMDMDDPDMEMDDHDHGGPDA